ncbi:MAG: RpiR family transcriptional regulator [Glaciihabitans sp.]|nr:RpiR family transcriptional regulator [Glaciihabitans sp.]
MSAVLPAVEIADVETSTFAGPLGERLRDAFAELSPQERRAAEFMREHLADLAVYNATEVAQLSGVSKATISRLYRRLGFENADEVRAHVRALRSSGAPVGGTTPPSFTVQLDKDIANLRAAFSALDLSVVAPLIAGAGRVLVIGFRNSYPIALHLRQQLAQVRDEVSLAPLPGQSLGEEIADLGHGDVVLLVGFRRRPEGFSRLVDAVDASPAALVLITDDGGRRYMSKADHLLVCPVDSASAFDSYAAAASVVSLLVASVLDHSGAAGRSRLVDIGSAYAALDELELY